MRTTLSTSEYSVCTRRWTNDDDIRQSEFSWSVESADREVLNRNLKTKEAPANLQCRGTPAASSFQDRREYVPVGSEADVLSASVLEETSGGNPSPTIEARTTARSERDWSRLCLRHARHR